MRSCLPARAHLTLLSGCRGLFVAPVLILLSEVHLRSWGWTSEQCWQPLAEGAELNPSLGESGRCGETQLPPFPRGRGRPTMSQQTPVPTVGLSLC